MQTIALSEFVLRSVSHDDVPRLVRWLSDPRVLEFWSGRDSPYDEEAVQRQFLARDYVPRFVVLRDGARVGYVQFYEIEPESRAQYQVSETEPAFGVDVFIGEPYLWGTGLGSQLMGLVARYLVSDYGTSRVFVDPYTTNERAIRAYEKAGFRKVRVLRRHELHEGSLRDSWLMEYKRRTPILSVMEDSTPS